MQQAQDNWVWVYTTDLYKGDIVETPYGPGKITKRFNVFPLAIKRYRLHIQINKTSIRVITLANSLWRLYV